MDHILFRKQNFRNIQLEHDTAGETVGVLRKDKKIDYIRWAGFIRRDLAKANRRAKPVLLLISRIDGNDLEVGEYVQGCLIENQVYAVIDSAVSVVKKNKQRK